MVSCQCGDVRCGTSFLESRVMALGSVWASSAEGAFTGGGCDWTVELEPVVNGDVINEDAEFVVRGGMKLHAV